MDRIKHKQSVLEYLKKNIKANIFELQRALNINNPAEFIRLLRKDGHIIATIRNGKNRHYEFFTG
jgi:predicted transcriptional regulator